MPLQTSASWVVDQRVTWSPPCLSRSCKFLHSLFVTFATPSKPFFSRSDKDFLKQYKEYMDLIKDIPHDLTEGSIPVLGSDVINRPKLFEFFDDTIVTARTP